MPAHSLRAGAEGLWTVLSKAGGSHTETRLGHSTSGQAQTCPEQQLAQTVLGEEEKQCGSAGITHLVECLLHEAGSPLPWNKVSLTVSCREYLFLFLAGIPPVKIVVHDLKTCAVCPMQDLEPGRGSLASSSGAVSGLKSECPIGAFDTYAFYNANF